MCVLIQNLHISKLLPIFFRRLFTFFYPLRQLDGAKITISERNIKPA